jgi:hypothetical protein
MPDLRDSFQKWADQLMSLGVQAVTTPSQALASIPAVAAP